MTITLEPTNSTNRPRPIPPPCTLDSFAPRSPSSWPRASSPPHTPRLATPIRSTGGRSARRAPGAPARSPACRRSRTSSTSASTTAACGAPPTTARPGCRSSTASRPDRSAPSRVAPSDPERHLRRQRRRDHSPGPRHRRRDVQVHRRRQDVDAPRPSRQPDDRDDRRRSDESEPAVRRRARPSLRTERRARNLPLDRRRPDVPESSLQG